MSAVTPEDYESICRLLASPADLTAGERVVLNLLESSYLCGEAVPEAELWWARAIALGAAPGAALSDGS